MNNLSTISWPTTKASEAVQAICHHTGMASSDLMPTPAASIDQAARELGVEVEPIGGSYQEIDQLVLGSAPAKAAVPIAAFFDRQLRCSLFVFFHGRSAFL